VTTYRIKPLAWVEKRTKQADIPYWEADSPFGVIQVYDRDSDGELHTPRFYWDVESGHDDFADTLDAAKSAAESWYRAKMCEGLEDVAS